MPQAEPTPGGATARPDLLQNGMRRAEWGRRCPSPASGRVGSWRRSDLPEVLPHDLLDLRETGWAVGISELERGRIHAIGFAIGSLRHPALDTGDSSRLVLNESTGATGGERCRCEERLSHPSGRHFTSGLSEHVFMTRTMQMVAGRLPM